MVVGTVQHKVAEDMRGGVVQLVGDRQGKEWDIVLVMEM